MEKTRTCKRSIEGESNRLASLPKLDKHWNWSDRPNILTLHKRIHRKYGPAKSYRCDCGISANDWAFIAKGEYTDKREDYKPMCRKCHIALDKPHLKRDRSNHQIIRDEKGRILTTLVIKN